MAAAIIPLLAAIDLDDAILVDILEDMWRIHQNANRAGRGHNKENVQLQAINDHGHVLPILASLSNVEN